MFEIYGRYNITGLGYIIAIHSYILGITDKKVGEVLSYALDAVLQDPSLNEKKKLLDLITKL